VSNMTYQSALQAMGACFPQRTQTSGFGGPRVWWEVLWDAAAVIAVQHGAAPATLERRILQAISNSKQASVDLTPFLPPIATCRRLFEGAALLRRMYRYGFLDESQDKLDYVLALTPADVLERRLQVRAHACMGQSHRRG
jgi:hypothetical protein